MASSVFERYRSKCIESFEFALENEFKVRSTARGNRGLTQLTLEGWPIQRAIVDEVFRQLNERGYVRIIILKSRRRGCSTIIQALIQWFCMTIDGIQGLTVAHEAAATRELFGIGKTICENLEPGIFPAPVGKIKGTDNSWENGSEVKCGTQGGSADSFRGWSPWILHLSEMPSWGSNRASTSEADVAQALLNSIYDRSGIVIIESTAKGVGNLFYRMWKRAENNEPGNEYVAMFFSWLMDPDCTRPHENYREGVEIDRLHARMLGAEDEHTFHSLANTLGYSQLERERALQYGLTAGQIRFWRAKLLNDCDGDQDKFDEEWPMSADLAFVASGNNVFSASLLRSRLKDVESLVPVTGVFAEEGFVEGYGAWEIYEEPEPGQKYVIACDPADGGTGKTANYTAIQVMKRNGREQVAEFYGKVPNDMAAMQIAMAFRHYRAETAAVETSKGGMVIIHHLLKHYPDVSQFVRVTKPGQFEPGDLANTLGFDTNMKTRPFMINQFEIAVRMGTCLIRSMRLLSDGEPQGELYTLIRTDGGRVDHMPGANDDASMAWAIALDVDRQLGEDGSDPEEPTATDIPKYFDGKDYGTPQEEPDPLWF